MMKRINGRDVALAAGCSQATVSRVIKSDPRISRETRKRVLDVARKLGYDMRSSSGGWGVGVIVCFDPNDINGYYAKGGALGVGRSSTKSIVISCILILMLDLIITQLMLY